MLWYEALGQAMAILNAAAGPAGGVWTAKIEERRYPTLEIRHDLSGYLFSVDDPMAMHTILKGFGPANPFHPEYDGVSADKPLEIVKSCALAARHWVVNGLTWQSGLSKKYKVFDMVRGDFLLALPSSPLQVWPVKKLIVLGSVSNMRGEVLLLCQDIETGALECVGKADLDVQRAIGCVNFLNADWAADVLPSYTYVLGAAIAARNVDQGSAGWKWQGGVG